MAIGFVQSKESSFNTSSTSLSVTLTSTATTGNCLILATNYQDTSSGVATCITTGGTGSDSFASVFTFDGTTPALKTAVFLLQTCGAGRTGATVTYTGGTAPTYGDLCIWEVSGLSNAGLDKTASNQGSGTSVTSGSTGTLSSAAEFAIAVGGGNLIAVYTSPWTSDGQTVNTDSAYGHQIVAATTALSATTTNTSGGWESVVATFNTSSVASLSATGIATARAFFPQPLFNSIVAVAGTPAMVQHLGGTTNNSAQSGNNYHYTLPNPVQSSNCLVLALTYPTGSTPVITDNIKNVWPSSPTVSAAGSGLTSAIFVLPNAYPGQTTISVNFSSSVANFGMKCTEFCNVYWSSPVSGSHSAADVAATSLACGSFTPTTNDSFGGNLIYAFFAASAVAGVATSPSSFTVGSGFELLDADRWYGSGYPSASEWEVQATAAAINPGVTAVGASGTFNCVAVALLGAGSGEPAPVNGIYVRRINHFSTLSYPTSGSVVIQCPAYGNLRLLAYPANTAVTFVPISGITDNDSNSWSSITGQPTNYVWYSANCAKDVDLTLTQTAASTALARSSWRFIDIERAAVAPLGANVAYGPVNATATVLDNAPIITPTTSNALIVANLGNTTGPTYGFDPGAATPTPASAVFDLVGYTGETDNDCLDNADIVAHYYNPNTTAVHWNWTMPGNGTATNGGAFEFKTTNIINLFASNLASGAAGFAANQPIFAAFIPIWVNTWVLDNGLLGLVSDADSIYICSQQPADFTGATVTYGLGSYSFGVGNAFGAPANGSPNGRVVTSGAISAGNITASGTPTYWAAIDTTNTRLLATGLLSASGAVVNGNQFMLSAVSVHLPSQ